MTCQCTSNEKCNCNNLNKEFSDYIYLNNGVTENRKPINHNSEHNNNEIINYNSIDSIDIGSMPPNGSTVILAAHRASQQF